MEPHTEAIFGHVVRGHREGVETSVRRALDDGTSPEVILTEGLVAAMDEVGRKFEACEFFVPEMLAAARAMKSGLVLLRPVLVQKPASTTHRVVMGTVQGDMHDIGKSLVGMMLEGAGFEVHDLGTDVSPAGFVQAVRDLQPSVVGLSALLTTTMTQMKSTIQAIAEANLRGRVKVIVGGAPVTEDFARAIGADGSAPDASRAVTLVRRLLQP
jgi:5-methyltetrahydrofolate--homocysteine methyltransferase